MAPRTLSFMESMGTALGIVADHCRLLAGFRARNPFVCATRGVRSEGLPAAPDRLSVT